MAPRCSAVAGASRSSFTTSVVKNPFSRTSAFCAQTSVSMTATTPTPTSSNMNNSLNVNSNIKLISCATSPAPSLAKPKISYRELLDSYNYEEPRHVTVGFDIDFDLGDSPHIVRPWRGSLDDPEVTNPARFAVDEYNRLMDANIKFEVVIKANYRASGDAYFLTFEATDNGGKKKRYRALVIGNKENKMKLMDFYLRDNNGYIEEPCMNKGPGLYSEAEEHGFPGGYFKYQEQVEASQGLDGDDDEKLELKNWLVTGASR